MTSRSAARLGGFSKEGPVPAREINTNNVAVFRPATAATDADRDDHFMVKDGIAFAGMHLLVELWNATNLSDVALTEATLIAAARQAGATVLHSYLHPFGPEMGVSGVVVLAESHISIHTWPERGYAAVDIFMCGDCDPYQAVDVLKGAFEPGFVQISEHKRGVTG
jgi:S-adenosylmethionine decarboxylase